MGGQKSHVCCMPWLDAEHEAIHRLDPSYLSLANFARGYARLEGGRGGRFRSFADFEGRDEVTPPWYGGHIFFCSLAVRGGVWKRDPRAGDEAKQRLILLTILKPSTVSFVKTRAFRNYLVRVLSYSSFCMMKRGGCRCVWCEYVSRSK